MIDHLTLLAILIVVATIGVLIVAMIAAIWLPPILDRRWNRRHPYLKVEFRTPARIVDSGHFIDWDAGPDLERLDWDL